jgi:hypothetical protein
MKTTTAPLSYIYDGRACLGLERSYAGRGRAMLNHISWEPAPVERIEQHREGES